jgi:hypothetical protein
MSLEERSCKVGASQVLVGNLTIWAKKTLETAEPTQPRIRSASAPPPPERLHSPWLWLCGFREPPLLPLENVDAWIGGGEGDSVMADDGPEFR